MKKKHIIVNSDEIQKAIRKVAMIINEDYKGLSVDLITLNKSADNLIQDLVKYLELEVRLQSLHFDNYDNQNASGEIRITQDIEKPVYERHIILLDGVIISGLTHYYICNYLNQRSPQSIALLCVGLKPNQVKRKLPKCYSLFEFNEEWVEGYGIGSESLKSIPYLVDLKKA